MADFGTALTALKAGKCATRDAWQQPGRLHGAYLTLMDLGAPFEPQLIVRYTSDPGIPPRPFSGAQWDLLSEDWQVMD